MGNQLRHLPVIFQPPDVVDHVGPCLQRRLHHRSLVAVYGDGDIKVILDHFDGGNYPVDLLLNADLLVAGAGGFAADVNDSGPVFDHIGGVTPGLFQVRPLAAVGKGIRRHIQNAHDVAVVVHIKQVVSDFHTTDSCFQYFKLIFFFSWLQLQASAAPQNIHRREALSARKSSPARSFCDPVSGSLCRRMAETISSCSAGE